MEIRIRYVRNDEHQQKPGERNLYARNIYHVSGIISSPHVVLQRTGWDECQVLRRGCAESGSSPSMHGARELVR